jgi:hypothetical protein
VAAIGRDALIGRWAHSHEEDSGGLVVYRPASRELPRSRGRDSFELRADGTLGEAAIGPADRPVPNEGRWELDAEGRLTLQPGAGQPGRVFQVVSADLDRLVLKRA